MDGLAAAKPQARRGTRRRSRRDRDREINDPQLTPGSAEDARLLRVMLSTPAKGVTVLCVDPPARWTKVERKGRADTKGFVLLL